jgi:hypothetical protein
MELGRRYLSPAGGTSGGTPPSGPSQGDVDNAEHLAEAFTRLQDTLLSVASILRNQINTGLQDADDITQQLGKDIAKSLYKNLYNSAAAIKDMATEQGDLTKKMLDAEKIENKKLEIQRSLISLEQDFIRLRLLDADLAAAQEERYLDAVAALNEQLQIANNQLEVAKKFEGVLGVSAKIMSDMSKIPIIGNLINAKKVLKDMETAATDGASKWKVLGVGIVSVFNNIASALTSPIGLLTTMVGITVSLVKFALDYEKKIFDTAKSLGTTVSYAESLRAKFVQIASASTNFGLTSGDLTKTYTELSDVFGFLAPTSAEFVENLTLIQKRLGISAQEAAALATQAALSNKTIGETYGIIQATRVAEGSRNKLALSNKQILDGMAKVSSTILVNFKGSVEALAQAVVRATKLGTTLDTINGQATKLIDFESSIQAEFEAQVLTGRELNLTRARELALLGDTRGLMEELNRQNITLNTYQGMNLIQREAFAAALGLSAEELSKQLINQERANRLGAEEGQSLAQRYEQLVKMGVEGEKILSTLSAQEQADLRRASVADRFNNTIERLKESLGKVILPYVVTFVDYLTDLLQKSGGIESVMAKIGRVVGTITNGLKALPTILGTIIGLMATMAIYSTIASGGINLAAAAAAVGVGAAIGFGTASGLGGSGAGSIAPINAAAMKAAPQQAAQQQASTSTSNNTQGNVFIDGQKIGKVLWDNADKQSNIKGR